MGQEQDPIIHIAVIGGGTYCKEFLEKTTKEYRKDDVNARITAVADPDPKSPGMLVAESLGLITVSDYHELYDPKYEIDLFIILTPDEDVLQDALETKPSRIRLQSYQVFEVNWKAISIEAKKLRRRNEEIETILNAIQDFIVVLSPDMEIMEVNDAFLAKLDYTHEEVVGRKCFEIFQQMEHPCDMADFPCPLKEVVRLQRPLHQTLKRVKPGQRPRYTEVSTFPIWEKDGRISKFIEISRDITERKKEEEEITRRLEAMVEKRTKQLQETHDQLLHQDKMASLGKLSASVVHEINNPLAGTFNLIKLMKRMIDEGPVGEKEIGEFKEFLNLMETESRRIIKIISNLLAFSRQSKMKPKQIHLNELIEKTLLLNSNLLKIHDIQIQKSLHPDLPDFIGSDDQLQQVFMNLISNAAESMESTEKRILLIESNHDPKEMKIWVRVKDTGIGIPEGNIPKLFEPFYTTKKRGKGVGLGLSVAYGIVQNHGGTIQVRSKENEGSDFKIEFSLK